MFYAFPLYEREGIINHFSINASSGNTPKSTVALVLAGGDAKWFPHKNTLNFKALLPVNGRPITDYVIQALEKSNAEKIFVLQEYDINLQEHLSQSSKSIFITKDKDHSSLGISVLFALANIAEYYGKSELSKKTIMVIPCDTPLVTKDNFNRLIMKMVNQSADITLSIIASKLPEKHFPQKKFRSFYLWDDQSTYTMQNIAFINGELIEFKTSNEPGKLNISFRGFNEDIFSRLEENINSVENLRNKHFFLEKLFFYWLSQKVYRSYVFKFLMDFLFNRLTMTKINEYISGFIQCKVDLIESEEVEFSYDIDRPDDFQMLPESLQLNVPVE